MMTRYVFLKNATPDQIERDDGGMSFALEASAYPPNPRDDEGMFVRVQSWSDRKNHPEFDALRGKFIVVTVEAFGDEREAVERLNGRAEEIAAASGDYENFKERVLR